VAPRCAQEVVVFQSSKRTFIVAIGLAATVWSTACQTTGTTSPDRIRGAGEAGVMLPQTSVARIFSAWLANFNAANRDGLLTVYQQFREPHPVEGALDLRRRTGGFDLAKVVESTPTTLRVWLRERNGGETAEARMDVDPNPPHQVVGWEVRRVSPS
jgi:hypothetical protein